MVLGANIYAGKLNGEIKCLTLGVKYTQVSSVAMSPSCYFAIFIHDPVSNDSNELRFLSHTGVTATAEIPVVFIGFHPKKNLEVWNYYEDKLVFSNCLRVAVIVTLNTLTNNETSTSYVWSR